jgi:hypothetical protein
MKHHLLNEEITEKVVFFIPNLIEKLNPIREDNFLTIP